MLKLYDRHNVQETDTSREIRKKKLHRILGLSFTETYESFDVQSFDCTVQFSQLTILDFDESGRAELYNHHHHHHTPH